MNRITGRMKAAEGGEPILFTTVRVGTDLARKLSEHNVKYSGRVESTFFTRLLSWIVPALLFFGLWYLLMKKMQGGQAGMMPLGLSTYPKQRGPVFLQSDQGFTGARGKK